MAKKKEFKTRLGLLQNTINYYWGKPERQCSGRAGCKYVPVSDETEGCAIGRLIPLELAKELDSTEYSGVSNYHTFNKLPQWLQYLGKDFLTDLQRLHDNNDLMVRNKGGVVTLMTNHVEIDKIKFPK